MALHLFFVAGGADNLFALYWKGNAMTHPAPAKRAFGATLIAVFWSFIGLRRKSDFDADAAGAMNPFYVVAAALAGAALFICALLLAVTISVSGP